MEEKNIYSDYWGMKKQAVRFYKWMVPESKVCGGGQVISNFLKALKKSNLLLYLSRKKFL